MKHGSLFSGIGGFDLAAQWAGIENIFHVEKDDWCRRVLSNTGDSARQSKASFPDMKLYEEIIFLDNFFNGLYTVENVIPYYEPLIPAKKRGRHLYWTNFNLPNNLNDRQTNNFIQSKVGELEAFHEIDLSSYKGKQRKEKIARNLVDFEAGRTIFETAYNVKRHKSVTQAVLF